MKACFQLYPPTANQPINLAKQGLSATAVVIAEYKYGQ